MLQNVVREHGNCCLDLESEHKESEVRDKRDQFFLKIKDVFFVVTRIVGNRKKPGEGHKDLTNHISLVRGNRGKKIIQ